MWVDREISKRMIHDHGMLEVERKRLLRAVSIAQAASPAFTSSWLRNGGTASGGMLRTY